MASTINSTVHTMAGDTVQPPATTTYMNDQPLVWRPWQQEPAWQQPISPRFMYDNGQNQHPRFGNSDMNTVNPSQSYFGGLNMNLQTGGTMQSGSFTQQLLGAQMPVTGFPQTSIRPTPTFRGYQQNRRVAVPYPAYQGSSVPAYQPRPLHQRFSVTRAPRPILPCLSDPRLRGASYNLPRGYPYNHLNFASSTDSQVLSTSNYTQSAVQVQADRSYQNQTRSPGPEELIQSCDGLSGGVMISSNSRLYQWYENEFRDNPCNSDYFSNVFAKAQLDLTSYLDHEPPQNISEAVKAYIDYLVFENRQRVMPLEQAIPSAPSSIPWSDMSQEDYFNDMMSEPTVVPTKKFIGWLRLFGMTASKNDLTNEIEIIPITTTSTPKKSTPSITAHAPWADIPLPIDVNNNEITHNGDILQSSARAAGIDMTHSPIPRSSTPLELQRAGNQSHQPAPQFIPNVTVKPQATQERPVLPKITIVKQDESAETTAAFVETLARLAKHQQERFMAGEPHTPAFQPTFTTRYDQLPVSANAFTSSYRSTSGCDRFISAAPAISSHSLPSLPGRVDLEGRDYELRSLAQVSSHYGARLCTNTPEPDSTSSGDQPIMQLPPIATLRKTVSSASNDADDESSSSSNSAHEVPNREKNGISGNIAFNSAVGDVWNIRADAQAVHSVAQQAGTGGAVLGQDYRVEVRDELDDSDSDGEVTGGEVMAHGVILVGGLENHVPTEVGATNRAVPFSGTLQTSTPHQIFVQDETSRMVNEEAEICRVKRRLSAEFSPDKKKRI